MQGASPLKTQADDRAAGKELFLGHHFLGWGHEKLGHSVSVSGFQFLSFGSGRCQEK